MKLRIHYKLLLSILSVLLVIYTATIGFVSISNRKTALSDAKELARSSARDYGNQTKAMLEVYMDASRTLAQAFTDFESIPETSRRGTYMGITKKVLESNPDFLSIWTIWEPMTIDKLDKNYIMAPGSTRIGNFSPTWYRENGIVKLEVSQANATLFQGDYFTIPKKNQTETILNPYGYSFTGHQGNQILQTSMITPIIKDGNFLGVIGVDASLETFQFKMKSARIFDDGYAFLVSNNGTFVAFKDKNFLGKPIDSLGNELITKYSLDEKIKNGEEISFTMRDPVSKKNSYVILLPIKIGNTTTPWSIGISVPMDTILSEARFTFWMTILTGVVGLIIMSIVIVFISRNITGPLKDTTQILENLSKGVIDEDHPVIIKTHDELGQMALALNRLSGSLKKNADFALAIGKNELDTDYKPLSKRDMLGNALLQMRDNLSELSKINANNSWLQSSIVEVSNILRGEKTEADLAAELLSKLANILHFQAGALYLLSSDEKLKLTGTYAFSHRKSSANEFLLGEGLVGQAALEKKLIVYSNVPKDFIYLQSGLTEGEVPNVIVQPFLFQGKIIGVLELAAVFTWDDLHCTFLDQMEESIAIAFHTITSRQEMRKLLMTTQEQSEELRVQQEELREANEELEQQTKALRQSEANLQAQQEELRVTNEELEEKTHILEQQRAAVAIKNKELETAKTEIERKAREVEQASKYKSEFLANMSHELRTPLNSLLILSRSLADNKKANLTKDQVEAAEIIYNSGNELLTLINDILDLSKIESGRMDINLEKVEPETIGDYTRMHFNHQLSLKGLKFLINIADDIPPYIVTDRQRIEQIIKNLMSNAIKFTSEGSITLSVERPEASIKFRNPALNASNTIAVSVVDTGIGISPEKQELIFEAFKQADGSTSRKYGGTGLGLSISRELAKLLGGEIQLKSEVGKGSKFTIYLPLDENLSKTVPKPSIASTSPQPVAKPMLEEDPLIDTKVKEVPNVESIPDDRAELTPNDRVMLIIEDDTSFARVLAKQTREKGFKILASSTGEEGINLAMKYTPAAIILDINLPGIDGWDVLERLKNEASTRHIPVHMMSAYDETIDAYKKGAIGYLTKPVNPDDLEQAFGKITHFTNRKMKDLLLVEDDMNLRKSIKSIIGEKDVKITDAGSGAAAQKALREKHFDCMVLDLGLPDMTGFELLKQLEADKSITVPPVIIYTGRELSKDEDRELHHYTDSIIIKGVKSEERLLDETALFLHRVVSEMPQQQQEIISFLHDKDTIFRNRKVLVVDDDMRNVIALTHVLEDKEIEVLAAENGQMAIDMLNQNPNIDIVLMDIMMPVMDGYETIGKIRDDKRFKTIPIIALTAKAMKEDRNKCINAGASDYIAKPVNIDKLLSLMRVWLHK
jgi:CheY-like chemotaxis protein/signal transduction histidine kinase/HAMP domain-containing protein